MYVPHKIIKPNSDEEDILTCNRCHKNEKNLAFYRSKYSKLLKRNNQLEKENHKLLMSLKKYKKSGNTDLLEKIDRLDHVNENSKEFCKIILSQRSQSQVYTEKQKYLSQNLYYKSTSSYLFMRESLGFSLPSKSSLHRWSPLKSLQCGINADLIQNLSKIVANMDAFEREAVLIFDEIKIRKELVYDPVHDQVEGVEDYGNGDRNSNIGKNICTFMIRGLLYNWKYVLSYYVSGDVIKGKKLKALLEENLKIAFDIGLNIRAVICDQASNNRYCFKLLKVTRETPYFYYDSKKIYCLYDVPHLIKSVRNILLDSDIESNDSIVSWDVIRELCKLDSSETAKICPKLTSKHIDPNSFDKMRVQYATQVFSKSVAAGIRTCIRLNKFSPATSQKAQATEIFVTNFDKIFDCLNSRNLSDKNWFKAALRQNNHVKEFLNEILTYIKSLRLIKKKTVFCIDGLIHSITAILSLSEDLFNSDKEISYLLTARLNQDVIENLFAQIRSKGGNTTNPSVYEFHRIIGKIMCTKILTTSNTKNCEDDGDELLDWSKNEIDISIESAEGEMQNRDKQFIEIMNEIERAEESTSRVCDQLNPWDEFLVESNARRYFVGYVILKIILKKINCNFCSDTMIKTEGKSTSASEFLIVNRDYSRYTLSNDMYLQSPSDEFFNICELQIEIYKNILKNHLFILNIKKTIFDACISKTNENYPAWFNGENQCVEHRKIVLDFMLLVLLRKNCLWKTKEIQTQTIASNTKNNKLKILRQ